MSSISSAAPDGQPPQGGQNPLTPYVVNSIAATAAIVPPFRYLIKKDCLQRGLPVPKITLWNGLKEGIIHGPKVGAIVGVQMALQGVVEKGIGGDPKQTDVPVKLASAAIVGVGSSPFLGVFNGSSGKLSALESVRRLSFKQCGALAVQETAFVAGQSLVEPFAQKMKETLGDHKAVESTAAFIAGATGSLVGHWANTAVTRWQNELKVENFRQLWWGALPKARAIGIFSVLYQWGKEALNSKATGAG